MPPRERLPALSPELAPSDALAVLRSGRLTVEGRITGASNATLYCSLELDGAQTACVYKPVSGERPLWDFPDGTLAAREVASYEVSRATGWDLVPPTVLRDGPFGVGMCQLWVDVDDTVEMVDVVPQGSVPEGWVGVLDAYGPGDRPVTLAHRDDPRLHRMAVLDAVINNADRKGGHILPTPLGALHGVDHGVTFNVDDKLRTVLWGWAGRPFDDEHVEVLTRLDVELGVEGPLAQVLGALLDPDELETTRRRVQRLLRRGRLPKRGDGWPAIPWPPF